jgi:3-hydroxymyristoyl/3-hydroxydecanoyl-(acyl carrier protein) dehydratase
MKFRLVDRVLDWAPERHIRGVKAVSFEEYGLRDPLGQEAALPETLLLESLFQLGNWLVVLSTGFRQMAMIVRIERACFDRPVGPGQAVVMQVDVRIWRPDGILFDGAAHVGRERVAHGEGCLAVPVPLDQLCDPIALKTIVGEIRAAS